KRSLKESPRQREAADLPPGEPPPSTAAEASARAAVQRERSARAKDEVGAVKDALESAESAVNAASNAATQMSAAATRLEDACGVEASEAPPFDGDAEAAKEAIERAIGAHRTR